MWEIELFLLCISSSSKIGGLPTRLIMHLTLLVQITLDKLHRFYPWCIVICLFLATKQLFSCSCVVVFVGDKKQSGLSPCVVVSVFVYWVSASVEYCKSDKETMYSHTRKSLFLHAHGPHWTFVLMHFPKEEIVSFSVFSRQPFFPLLRTYVIKTQHNITPC